MKVFNTCDPKKPYSIPSSVWHTSQNLNVDCYCEVDINGDLLQPVSGFSTAITPNKKPARSNVPSASVQAFLAKREKEQQDKVKQAIKEKERLLALRAQNSKSNKAAKLMASRTKDNDFSRIRLTEDQVETRDKVEAQLRRQVINDKVERMKARIKLEEHEAQQPHKRKRKPKSHDNEEYELSPSPPPPSPPPQNRPNGTKKPRAPCPPPMSFEALIKMAAVKQYEDPNDDLDRLDTKTDRPMTKAGKLDEEYKRYKMNGGTAGRTAFEIEYFRMQEAGGSKSKKATKKGSSSGNEVYRESRSAYKPPVIRSSAGDSAQLSNEPRNAYQSGGSGKNAQRPAEKIPQRPADNRSGQQGSRDSNYSQRPVENPSSYRTSDSRNVQRPNENKNVQRSHDNKSVQRTNDNRSVQRPSDNRSVQRPSDNRSVQRTSDNRSVQRTSDNRSVPRTSDNRSVQRPNEYQTAPRASDNRKPNEYHTAPRGSDNRSGLRTSEGVSRDSAVWTSGNKGTQRPSDNRSDLRTQDNKTAYRTQDRQSQSNVPSYTTVKKPSVKPVSDTQRYARTEEYENYEDDDSQYNSRPQKHESAFLNSLPTKKPRLDYPQRDMGRPVLKQEPQRDKQTPHPFKTPSKPLNSKEKSVSGHPRNGQLNNTRIPKRESDVQSSKAVPNTKGVPSKSNKPEDKRPAAKTKVSLNENWLDDDAGYENLRMIDGPKKKVLVGNAPSDRSGAAQKRPLESESRNDRSQDQRHFANQVKQDSRKSSDSQKYNSNGQYKDRKPAQQQERRQEQASEKQRAPEKRMKTGRENAYDELDRRSENRPSGKKTPASERSEERKVSSGPAGSRRPLDSLWPMKSMARNPNKLPPIRSSKCSYIKSDSEEEEDEFEEDEFDDDMADFIDDGPQPEEEDYSRHIREIFGYDKRKYRNEKFDDDVMESSYAQQMKEEARSRRIGRLEDLEEEKKELERKQREVKDVKTKR